MQVAYYIFELQLLFEKVKLRTILHEIVSFIFLALHLKKTGCIVYRAALLSN